MRLKKKAFYEDLLKELEQHNQLNESRKFYKLTNNLRKDFKPKILTCRNLNGDFNE